MTTHNWRGDPDDAFTPPRITRRIRRWLALRIDRYLKVGDLEARLSSHEDDEQRAKLVRWYLEMPERYVQLLPYADLSASRTGAIGEWSFLKHMVVHDLKQAKVEALQSFASLDEWLRADIEGRVEAMCGNSEKLPEETQNTLRHASLVRQGYWPRECRRCRTSFVPTEAPSWLSAQRVRTCRACLDAKRQKAKGRRGLIA